MPPSYDGFQTPHLLMRGLGKSLPDDAERYMRERVLGFTK